MAKTNLTRTLIKIGGRKKTNAISKKKLSKKKIKSRSYSIYIYRILKELKPFHSITQNAMNVMNAFVNDMYKRIAKDACDLVNHSNRKILGPDDIKAAVKLNLNGELGVFALREGERALRMLQRSLD